ncbi:MAG: diguanylate cyclase [Aquimonas sp.]|nr:diguanylate cyclase [Aquimonas sp.]
MNAASDSLHRRRTSVATQLFVAGLGLSLLVALLAAALLLLLLRSAELEALDQRYTEIERVHLQSLAAGLWAVDGERVRVAFDAISQLEDMGRLQLTDDRGERMDWRAPDYRVLHSRRSFDLFHLEFGERIKVGRLEAELSRDRVNASLWREGGLIFGSVLLTLLAASLVLQWLFRHRVGRHLEALARHASSLSPDTLGRPVVLARPPTRYPDELDTVAQAMEEMGRSLQLEFATRARMLKELQRSRDALETRVEERTLALREEAQRTREALAELEQSKLELDRRANTDALTGLANRGHLDLRLRKELARAQRSGQALSVVLVDIDHFKQINDRFGHAQGDTALREVAHCLQMATRPNDLAGRWGGEEFLLILPGTDSTGASALGERLRETVDLLLVNGVQPIDAVPDLRLSITLGVACWNREETPEALIARADQALYAGKQSGRNRVVVAS